MFAVPGWSISPSTLKTQTEPPRTNSSAENAPDKSEGRKSRKRKRGSEKVNGTNVTADNVAALWQRHIEGIIPGKKGGEPAVGDERKKKKRRRKGKDDIVRTALDEQDVEKADSAPASETKQNGSPEEASIRAMKNSPEPIPQDGKAKYEQRKAKAQQKQQQRKSGALPPPRVQSTKPPPIPAPPSAAPLIIPPAPRPTVPATTPTTTTSKLTPLQTAMRAKLISARFRHLNQTLYTTPSSHAASLFSSDSQAFTSYHTGFRAQVASWPQNPVEIFIREIRSRGEVKGPRSQKQLFREQKKQKKGGKGKGNPKTGGNENEDEDDGPNGAADDVKFDPLPRSPPTTGSCTILDLGCGDAHLHASLLPHASTLNLSLRSFDLAAPTDIPNANLVTLSDIAHLPVANNSADVAIFCLALMGTNWIDFVAEAARVVRVGGECWVGEVRSRFVGGKEMDELKEKIGGSAKGKGGKGKNKKGKMNKENADEVGNENVRQPPVTLDEDESVVANGKQNGSSTQRDTDVKPFVDVFRRRGFSLKGDVDLGNKMFVRMRFVRVRDAAVSAAKRDVTPRFIEKEEAGEVPPEIEAKVLKPCVYKTR
ncbi:MAG: hypothetical protein Q9220_005932 [cf. Caloplaca sp. 1 TL-2023]